MKVVILKSGLQNLTWDLGLEEIKWPNVWLIGRVEKVKEVELVDDVIDYFSEPTFTATVDFEKEKGKVMTALEEVRKSELFADLSARLDKLKSCQELWCFGLGHVAACVSARYQLALLLLLRSYHFFV